MGKTICNLVGFVHTLCGMVSIYTLTALSIYRWWQVFPCRQSSKSVLYWMSRYLTSYVVIIITWAMAFSLAISPILGWSSYIPENHGISCAPAWKDPDGRSFIVYMLVIGFAIPNLIIINTSALVIHYHNKNSSCTKSSGTVAEISRKREKKVTAMVILMVVAFNVSWTPYASMCVFELFQQHNVPPLWKIPVLVLAKSSCCWNPIIYVFLNTQFRNAIFSKQSGGLMGDATRRAEIGRLMTFTANGIIKTNPSFQIIERPTCNKDASNSKIDETELENLKTILEQVLSNMTERHNTGRESLRDILDEVMLEIR